MIKIPAGKFKAECLKIMDEVQELRREVLITKYGKPVAKLVPVDRPAKKKSLFGFMKGSVIIKGDIVKPTGVKWKADQ